MSIVGVGGVGKTRLALRVGLGVVVRRSRTACGGASWLGCVTRRRSRSGRRRVGVHALPGRLDWPRVSPAFFRHKQLLLVLDNCEHLLGAVAAFVRATNARRRSSRSWRPAAKRWRSKASGSIRCRRSSCPLDTSPFAVEESEAGALFATRAARPVPSFAVTDENAAAIAELCARLDGNALAIELAAARTTMMSPSEILARLDQRFRLLDAGGRDAVRTSSDPPRRDRLVLRTPRPRRASAVAAALGLRRRLRSRRRDRDRRRRRPRGIRRGRSAGLTGREVVGRTQRRARA